MYMYAIVFLYTHNNSIIITMYVYYVCSMSLISLSHVPVCRYTKIVVWIVLVSVVLSYYNHNMIVLR